jgi:hypothetical protein
MDVVCSRVRRIRKNNRKKDSEYEKNWKVMKRARTPMNLV